MKLTSKERMIIASRTVQLVGTVEERFSCSRARKPKRNLGYYLDNYPREVCLCLPAFVFIFMCVYC